MKIHASLHPAAAAALLFLIPLRTAPAAAVISEAPAADALSSRARAVLHRIVAEDQTFVKIHAAETLMPFGEAESMRRLFLAGRPANEASAYRVGVWRILATTAVSPAERALWIGKVEQVFLDPAANRVQALETLCKLGYRVRSRSRDAVRELAAKGKPGDAVMALWSLAVAGEPGALERIAAALSSGDPEAKMRAGYALRWLHPAEPGVLRSLARAADSETPNTHSYTYILSAALAVNADPAKAAAWRGKLLQVLAGGPEDDRFEAAQGLAPTLTPADLPLLARLLDDPNKDTRIGAARCILTVEARRRG